MLNVESVARELDDAVTAFAKKELGPARARAVRTLKGGFDRRLWKRMAELGWVGILVPEIYGGLGLKLREMAIVARRLAASILPEPLSACAVLATGALLRGDNEALKTSLLPSVCAGDLMPTVAWQERAGDLDDDRIATEATETPGGFALSGTKRFVPYGDVADGFIVSARSAGGAGLYWISATATGVNVEGAKLADGSTQATVSFDRSSSQMLRTPGKDLSTLAQAVDVARVTAAAELLGVASACLEITLQYLRARSQFGKPIGSFQALQHRAVDLYVLKEFSVSAVDAAVAHFDSGATSELHGAMASRAKARCSHTALEVARESIQLHGAIGWTDECDVGLYVKRALILSAWLGNAAANRRRYARLNPVATAGN